MSQSAPFGIILAGGQARRMGGGDKGLLTLGGESLLARVIARLEPQVDGLALNANGDAARFAAFDLPVLADGVPGYPGPLAGVLAGMEHAATLGHSHVLSAAADTPFFPCDLGPRLQLAGEESTSGLALAASADAEGTMWRQPTFGLWPVALAKDLRAALEDGLRKVVAWTDRYDAATAVFPNAGIDPFFNVNTPEDLTLAETFLVRA